MKIEGDTGSLGIVVGDTKAIISLHSGTSLVNFLNETVESIPIENGSYSVLSHNEDLVCFTPTRSSPIVYNIDTCTNTIIGRGDLAYVCSY